MENWVTRENRIKSKSVWRKITVMALLLIAIGLVVYRYHHKMTYIKNLIGVSSPKVVFEDNVELTGMLRVILNDFRLSKVAIEQQPLSVNKHKTSYPCYNIAWPDDFPYTWFIEKTQMKASEYGNINLTAAEIDSGKRLAGYMILPLSGDTLAEIVLYRTSRISPDMSAAAFILSEFADYRLEDALEFIWMDIPFGFVLKPDQIPGDKLSKALSTSRGQCYLELPADRQNWDLILNVHRLAKRIRDVDYSEDNFRAILEAFPVLDGFYFSADTPNMPDREIIKLIIEQAEFHHLAYITGPESPAYADSLAYLKGMKIRTLNGLVDCRQMPESELRNTLITAASDFSKYNKGIYLVDSDTTTTQAIKAVLDLYKRLNIVQSKPLRLAETVDKL